MLGQLEHVATLPTIRLGMKLFLLSMVHSKLRLRYVLARVAVLVAMAGAGAAASGEILRRVFKSDPGAVAFRWDMIYSALDMVKAHPVFGVGVNTFVAHFPQYSEPRGAEAVTLKYGANWPVVHNSYLITWSQQGTLGLICLLSVYGALLWTAWRAMRTLIDDRLYAMSLGAFCGIVAIMIDGLGSFFIDENAGERVFFMVAGLIYALSYWTEEQRRLRAAASVARSLALEGPR